MTLMCVIFSPPLRDMSNYFYTSISRRKPIGDQWAETNISKTVKKNKTTTTTGKCRLKLLKGVKYKHISPKCEKMPHPGWFKKY